MSRRPLLVLAVAMVVAAVVLLWVGRGTGYIYDEWYFWAQYRPVNLGTLLEPGNGNLILGTILVYKTVLQLWGIAYVPLRIIEVALVLGGSVLFYFALRAGKPERDWLVLGPAILLMFFGTSPDQVVSPIGIASMLGIVFGLAAMICVERNSPRWDLATFALLLAGTLCFTSTTSFVIAAAVLILFDRHRRWRRLLFPALLLVGYAVYRHQYRDTPTLDGAEPTVSHILHSPQSLWQSIEAGVTSAVGVYPLQPTDFLSLLLTLVLVGLFVAFVVWRLRSGPPVDRRVYAYGAGLFVLWFSLAALGKGPSETRYQYEVVLFLFAVLIELAAGIRLPAWLKAAAAAVLVFALVTNVAHVFQARHTLIVNTHRNEAKLAALELIRDQVPFNFGMQYLANPEEPLYADIYAIETGEYFAAAAVDGSPAMSAAELRAGSEEQRTAADRLMFNGLQLPTRISPRPLRDCAPARRAAAGTWIGATGPIAAGGFGVRAGAAPVTVLLRRYGSAPTTEPLEFTAGSSQWLEIPPDRSPLPWHAALRAGERFDVCAAPGGPGPAG